MAAGSFRDRLRFEKRSAIDDGSGNLLGDFAAQFTQRAQVLALKGGESVMAARLEGRQPVIITVYHNAQTALITPDWRAVDARSGVVYALQSAIDQDRQGRTIVLTAEAGVAS